MADKANPCTEGTLAVGTGDEGDVILRIAGSGFHGLPPLLCCSGPVGLAYLGALAVCSQESGVMANAFRDVFKVSLKRFFWPPWDRFPCCSSP